MARNEPGTRVSTRAPSEARRGKAGDACIVRERVPSLSSFTEDDKLAKACNALAALGHKRMEVDWRCHASHGRKLARVTCEREHILCRAVVASSASRRVHRARVRCAFLGANEVPERDATHEAVEDLARVASLLVQSGMQRRLAVVRGIEARILIDLGCIFCDCSA